MSSIQLICMSQATIQEKLRRAGPIFWNDTLTGVFPDLKKTLSTQISFIFRIKSYPTGSAFAESGVPIRTVQSRGNFLMGCKICSMESRDQRPDLMRTPNDSRGRGKSYALGRGPVGRCGRRGELYR